MLPGVRSGGTNTGEVGSERSDCVCITSTERGCGRAWAERGRLVQGPETFLQI